MVTKDTHTHTRTNQKHNYHFLSAQHPPAPLRLYSEALPAKSSLPSQESQAAVGGDNFREGRSGHLPESAQSWFLEVRDVKAPDVRGFGPRVESLGMTTKLLRTPVMKPSIICTNITILVVGNSQQFPARLGTYDCHVAGTHPINPKPWILRH